MNYRATPAGIAALVVMNYEETKKYHEYMNEFDSVEVEIPNRFIYAFKWMAKLMYGDERCIDALFIEMLRNTADKFGVQIPKLAEIRYEMTELDKRAEEYLQKQKKE